MYVIRERKTHKRRIICNSNEIRILTRFCPLKSTKYNKDFSLQRTKKHANINNFNELQFGWQYCTSGGILNFSSKVRGKVTTCEKIDENNEGIQEILFIYLFTIYIFYSYIYIYI